LRFDIVESFSEFEVLTAVAMNSPIFWHIRFCSPLKVNRRFGGIFFLLQGRRISQARNRHGTDRQTDALHAACYMLYLFFDPEEGSDMFL
jgi:hypothetical protein